MCDELKSGFMSQREIEEALKGSHMIGLSSAQRKADAIMKQAVSVKPPIIVAITPLPLGRRRKLWRQSLLS